MKLSVWQNYLLASVYGKWRLTGGEPLLRKDLTKLIARLVKIDGLIDIGLTTNAIHLTETSEGIKRSWIT